MLLERAQTVAGTLILFVPEPNRPKPPFALLHRGAAWYADGSVPADEIVTELVSRL
jgi:hypothetical protein